MPTPKTYSFSLPSTLTGNAIVDSLISGTYWLGANWTPTGPTNLSYSFMAPGTSYFVIDYSPDNEYNALYELTTGQKNAVTSALGAWSAVANLNFTLTTDTISNVGDMRFGGYRLMDDKTAAWAYFPSNTPVAGDVWIGPQTNDANPGKGSYDYLTFVHEIGHALGLKHPFDTSSTNNTLLDPTLDDVHFTVMSYNSNYSYQATTPMVLDIIAIQSLYGANMAWQAGDTVYKWAANQSIFETIWDGGGNDTIDGSNQLAAVSINLNEGAYSQIGKAFVDYNNLTAINDGLAIAYGAKIENAVGSEFNDILTGNALNNTLDGGAGADTMSGGDGVDTYYVDNVGDVVIETDASLTALDRVFSSIDYILGANVENLILTGTANLNGTGNSVNNRMTGNDGNNVLDGGLGADTLIGGLGNDTYIVDNLGDTVTETSTLISEIDTVQASVDFTLGANLENLVLTGNAVNGTGNALNNTLTGNAAANTLDGGAGADTMIGGDGVDTYYVDNVGDVVIESDASLTALDRVFSSIDYTLGANVENLILTGNAINGTGNERDNRITGNALANTLNGGLGADTMIGGDGVDTYYVDNVGDQVIETDASLTALDRVFSSIDYTLGANVENLILTGTANLNGTGSSVNNRMTGNDGDNVLDGGLGADTLIGGLGNDTYIVDNLGDTVTETSTLISEIDTVRSSVDYTLGANLENLVLTGNAVNGTGNALNNTLTGNAAANTLDGGVGADTMIGGDGVDTYYVDNVGDVVIETDASLTALDRVFSSIDYTLGANVENLILTGNAINGTGNERDNRITGNALANTLNGGLGADTMIGGDGVDTYYVDNVGDQVIETDASLTALDRVFSSIDYTLGANVENLILTGTANLNGTGSSVNNRMTGNDGDNVLDGGLGADTLIGGLGNDTYIVDNLGDTVTETSTLISEIDTVQASVDFTLGANLENLVLTGNAVNGTGNALNNTLTGNAAANTLDGGAGADTMIGGDGVDTYYVDNVGDVVIESDASLTALDRVFSSIDYTLGANVENLILTGTTNLNGTGNSVSNRMTGNDANNVLDGGLGTDTLIGGLGNDTYIVDNLGDTVNETSTLISEIDTVRASVDWTLGANLENLLLTGSAINGTGNSLNNVLTGNSANNTLNGGAGDDTLDGGLGADTMIGGDGVDTYYVDNVGDQVIETDASLTALDRVFSSIDYILGANVENLILTGTANLNGTGNSVNNRMTGNDGNNVLDGGLGADTLIGGLGNDTYIVDNLGDTVTETSTLISEIDTVRSSVDFTLGANLENLVLTGNAVNGTGNALNNTLTGNAAANTLDGGVGADTMIGGDGVDTYYVDNVGDVVIETDASLTALDRVFSSIDYTLGANVENLILTGTANLNGTGNSVNNRMTGNIGNNILDGGMGVDTMIGGAGNDTYVVDNINDVVIEQVGEGHDLIRTSSSYTLGANVEDLTMTGSADGSLTGNALENVITGNAGTNYIDGGLGADTLIGGGGGDVYLVDNINDVVIELADGGNDSVWTSVDYTLSDNVEDGMMIGNNNLNLTGNALNNNLNGNEGDNILSGGLGADRMFGAGGDDTYIVDNVNDVVLEAPDKGHDLVRTSVDYTLGDNVEDGTLLGSADLSLWGNNLDNILTGNSGNNVIWGYDGIDKLYGGAGNDTLYGGLGNTTLNGGTGADSFAFTNLFLMNAGVPGGGPHNVIADFNALEGDKIDFSDFDSSPNTLGLQHMTFIGSNEFTGFGQLRFVDQVLSGNMSPNEGGYFEVQLVGVHSFSANDVIV
ncbi:MULTISPECIES: M10 family metallopeptidase [unclassified Pseudomonas]|nr:MULTISPECIES: M10 family metallopeptidase [unclassified Pseudomonas]